MSFVVWAGLQTLLKQDDCSLFAGQVNNFVDFRVTLWENSEDA